MSAGPSPPFQLPRSQQHPLRSKKSSQIPSLTPEEAEIKLLKQELTIAKTKVIEIEQENKDLSRKLEILSESLKIYEKEQNQSLRAKYFPSSRLNSDTLCAPSPALSPDSRHQGLDTSTLNRVINHLLDTIDMSRTGQHKPIHTACTGSVYSSMSQSSSTLPATSSPSTPAASDATGCPQSSHSKSSQQNPSFSSTSVETPREQTDPALTGTAPIASPASPSETSGLSIDEYPDGLPTGIQESEMDTLN